MDCSEIHRLHIASLSKDWVLLTEEGIHRIPGQAQMTEMEGALMHIL